RPNFRVQSDYEINMHHSVSATLQSNLNYFDNFTTTRYTNLNRNRDIYRLSTRENASDGNGYNNSATFSYTYRGKNLAERLQVIANANTGKNDNGRDFFQAFLQPDFTPTGIDSTQIQGIDNYSKAFSVKADYTKPLSKNLSLTAGASYYKTNNHNILNTEFLRKQDTTLVLNDILSSNFRFEQNISTIRAAISYKLGKDWRVTAGVGSETTTNSFEFIKGNAADVSSTYSNILPNFTLRKDFTRTINTALVYRKSIRRPGIGELNPAIDYADPYNVRFGNPYLSPSLADNFDWNLGLGKGKYYINASIGYNRVKDIYKTIRTLIESGKTQTTYMNISSRQEYETSIFGGYTFSRKLRMNASAGYTYNQYSEQDIKLFNYRNGSTFYTSVNYSYNPSTLTTLDGNARFSSFADPQGRARSNLTMNLGIQHKFFNKRLIVSFNAIDPFTAQKFVTYTYGAKFTSENYNSTRTRNFRIAVSYQLNKVAQKSNLSDKQKKELLKKVQK
ncbi:MAG TPA: outer membrane beta-barrel family protein, partial [Segetibacter sp.]